jgi:hypothetical protein
MVKGGWLHGGRRTVSRRKRMTDRHKTDNLSFSNCVEKEFFHNNHGGKNFSTIIMHIWYSFEVKLVSFMKLMASCFFKPCFSMNS